MRGGECALVMDIRLTSTAESTVGPSARVPTTKGGLVLVVHNGLMRACVHWWWNGHLRSD